MRVFAFPGSSEAPFGGDVSSEALAASDAEVCWGLLLLHESFNGREEPGVWNVRGGEEEMEEETQSVILIPFIFV